MRTRWKNENTIGCWFCTLALGLASQKRVCSWRQRVTQADLELDESQSAPAYSRVKVVTGIGHETIADGLIRRMGRHASDILGKGDLNRCIVEKDGGVWLSSQETVWALQPAYCKGKISICGPVGRTLRGNREYVPCLRYKGRHPAAIAFIKRKRPIGSSWPRRKTLNYIRFASVPLLLVCTGHKASRHRDLEFRLSWSIYEVLLAKDMPLWVRQGYSECSIQVYCEEGDGRKTRVCRGERWAQHH